MPARRVNSWIRNRILLTYTWTFTLIAVFPSSFPVFDVKDRNWRSDAFNLSASATIRLGIKLKLEQPYNGWSAVESFYHRIGIDTLNCFFKCSRDFAIALLGTAWPLSPNFCTGLCGQHESLGWHIVALHGDCMLLSRCHDYGRSEE